MKYLIYCFILFTVGCTAQKNDKLIDDNYYIKSHAILADIIGKNSDTVYMLERFDFSNHHKLSESFLFDEMFKRNNAYFLLRNSLELSQDELNMVRDKNGWLPASTYERKKSWDVSLFKDSTFKLVQEIKRQGLIKPGQKVDFYIKPLRINFKQNFALIEFENLLGEGNELQLYKNLNGKWRIVASATDMKFAQE